MSTLNDGGPAFPSTIIDDSLHVGGMSLRDYFAAKAIQGMMANNWNTNYDDWAKHAYRLADAMIKARVKALN